MNVSGERSVGALVRDLNAAGRRVRTGGVISKGARIQHSDLLDIAAQALTELAHRLHEATARPKGVISTEPQ